MDTVKMHSQKGWLYNRSNLQEKFDFLYTDARKVVD